MGQPEFLGQKSGDGCPAVPKLKLAVPIYFGWMGQPKAPGYRHFFAFCPTVPVLAQKSEKYLLEVNKGGGGAV